MLNRLARGSVGPFSWMAWPALLLVSCSTAPAPAASQEIQQAVVEDTSKRKEIFETVWSRVNEKHFDPKYNGVDWAATKIRYAPLIEKAEDGADFYRILNRMLGELGQTHLGVIPPQSARAQEIEATSKNSREGQTGLVLGWVESLPTVIRILPSSPAERTGVKTGWAILAIGEQEIAGQETVSHEKRNATEDVLRLRTIQSRLDGTPGSTIDVRFDDGKESRVVPLVRETLPVERGSMMGFPVEVEFESKTLEGEIGYIRFKPFSMELLSRIQAAIRSFRQARGLVIDLRGNPGGIGQMVSPIAAMLLRERTELGTMLLREGELRFPVFPRAKPFDGPVAVLIDAGSASTSEVFAGSMQELGRVIVVGETSAGAVLPSMMEILPDGAILQYVVADYRTPKGIYLEGKGVRPDREVVVKREALREGRDPILEAALEEIQKPHSRKENP